MTREREIRKFLSERNWGGLERQDLLPYTIGFRAILHGRERIYTCSDGRQFTGWKPSHVIDAASHRLPHKATHLYNPRSGEVGVIDGGKFCIRIYIESMIILKSLKASVYLPCP